MLDSIVIPVLDVFGQGGTTTRRKRSNRARRTYVTASRPRMRSGSRRAAPRARKSSRSASRRY